MKIKLGKWKVDTSTFIRIEWCKPFPKLVLHEKYEKGVKWLLRILTLIGIATSIIALPPVYSLLLSIVLVLIEQFFEKTIFEYSVFYISQLPDFDIDYSQWLTSGYLLLSGENRKLLTQGYHNHFGPAYRDKNYAIKFFNYLRIWNDSHSVDSANNICVSIIIENNENYSVYLYPNIQEEKLDKYFSKHKEKMALKKYGKKQQELIMQTLFWKRNITQGNFFKQFIDDLKTSNEYYFAPFYVENGNSIIIDELKILKNQIKIRNRSELTTKDIEYHFK